MCLRFCVAGLAMNEIVLCRSVNDFVRFIATCGNTFSQLRASIIHDNFYSSQIWYWPARDKSAAADQFLATNLGVIRIEEHLDAFRELRKNHHMKSLFVYLHNI